MAEWPPADRLRQALDEIDDAAESSDDAWECIQDKIEGRLVPVSQRQAPPRRAFATGLAGAVLAAAVVAGLFLVLGDPADQGQVTTTVSTPDVPTAAPTTDTDQRSGAEQGVDPLAGLPSLSTVDDGECDPMLWGEYRSPGTGSLWAGGEVGTMAPTRAVHYLVDQPAGDFADATGLAPGEGEVLMVAGPEAGDPALLVEAFEAGVCVGPVSRLVLVGSITTEAADLLCNLPLDGHGWLSFALIGTSTPAPDCAGGAPTYLIDRVEADSGRVEAWADTYGCGTRMSRADDAGNVITEWTACARTLLHVQTSTQNPWDAVIDGEPTDQFLKRQYDIPR